MYPVIHKGPKLTIMQVLWSVPIYTILVGISKSKTCNNNKKTSQ